MKLRVKGYHRSRRPTAVRGVGAGSRHDLQVFYRPAPYEIRRDKAMRACEAWATDESLNPAQRNIAWRIRGQWKWLDRDERLAVLKEFTGDVGCLETIDKLIW